MNISSCAHTVHGKRNELGKTTSRYRPRRGRKFDPGTARARKRKCALPGATLESLLPPMCYCGENVVVRSADDALGKYASGYIASRPVASSCLRAAGVRDYCAYTAHRGRRLAPRRGADCHGEVNMAQRALGETQIGREGSELPVRCCCARGIHVSRDSTRAGGCSFVPGIVRS